MHQSSLPWEIKYKYVAQFGRFAPLLFVDEEGTARANDWACGICQRRFTNQVESCPRFLGGTQLAEARQASAGGSMR